MENAGESTPLLQKEPVTSRRHNGHGTLLARIRNDKIYRAKFITTIYLTWAFAVFGWLYGQMGPTIPDLQLLLDLDLKTASWLFTSLSFGYMIGCLCNGAADGKVNPKLLLFIALFGSGVSTVAVPWCPYLWLMLLVRATLGFFIGGIDTAGHALLVAVWKGDMAMYVQIAYFFFGLGGLLSPIVTKPFLAPPPFNSSNGSATEFIDNVVYSSDRGNCTNCTNWTVMNPQTNVQWAFLITGILAASASFPFLLQYCTSRSNYDIDNADTTEGTGVIRKQPSRGMFIFILCCLAMFMIVASGWVDTFSGFLMTFCLHELNWTKQTGSLISSLFWVSFAVGNFVCIFLVQFISTTALLLSFFVLSIIGQVGLLVGSYYHVLPLIWVCVLVLGFAMSTLWPSTFTWTEETVTEVSGRVSSMLCVCAGIGLMVNPLAVGYSMNNISYMWYTYILLGESITVLAMLTFLAILYKRMPLPQPKSVQINDL